MSEMKIEETRENTWKARRPTRSASSRVTATGAIKHVFRNGEVNADPYRYHQQYHQQYHQEYHPRMEIKSISGDDPRSAIDSKCGQYVTPIHYHPRKQQSHAGIQINTSSEDKDEYYSDYSSDIDYEDEDRQHYLCPMHIQMSSEDENDDVVDDVDVDDYGDKEEDPQCEHGGGFSTSVYHSKRSGSALVVSSPTADNAIKERYNMLGSPDLESSDDDYSYEYGDHEKCVRFFKEQYANKQSNRKSRGWILNKNRKAKNRAVDHNDNSKNEENAGTGQGNFGNDRDVVIYLGISTVLTISIVILVLILVHVVITVTL